ncbi:reverse transcriptase domain-containing protein [Flavobacterium sp. 140616W15]|uniref:reverse transcriptase domain-containing protein n=1 Tax=Flavobacterium sp. 140616W15 TaxID=2478552 RepID=UPI000F0C5303|nr:reverse transcriptase domain-containing protein [Flavobacterium sp. 140616W15]AYN03749.1 hypothetical protein EAG11_05835 [Flavobacterium sp. 140616W15]
MTDLDLYFTDKSIIELLCKYRVNEANKRHSKHMIRNVSLHKSTNKVIITNEEKNFKFLQNIFPSRRDWKKLNEKERKIYNDTLSINRKRLFKSYLVAKREIDRGGCIPVWYSNLLDFVHDIQNDIQNIQQSNFRLRSPNIKGIKKEVKDGIIIYRPIALYDFKEKIICSLTSKYLVNYFENLFNTLDCSYAFRPKRVDNTIPDHHDCISEIINYKKRYSKLWVAECDIQKFFDAVQHQHIVKVFDRHASEIEKYFGVSLDSRAKKIFNLFLDSFNFQENILSLTAEWFETNRLPFGKFKWVEKDLNLKFGSEYTKKHKIGVPQGNAISCFIANLILHDVDVAVKNYSNSIFYIRYCDDMILMHTEEKVCSEALKIYMDNIDKNFLLFHEPEKFINYKDRLICKEFWKSKSKEPFLWGDKNSNEQNVPWLSFVGYQVDYQNRVRVRKSTLKKETKKQIFETQKVIKSLGKHHRNLEVQDEHARLSKGQIVFRIQQRLISMSVGRVTIHNHKRPLEQGFCWTNGFKKLDKNRISSKQLRFLDKRRNIQIQRINRELNKIVKETEVATFPDDLKHIKFGGAYSYYNYLKHK